MAVEMGSIAISCSLHLHQVGTGLSPVSCRTCAAYKKRGLGAKPRPQRCTPLERRRVRCFGNVIRSVGASGESFRFWLAAVELADDVGANAPERLLVGLSFFASAVCAFVSGANEAALDEHVRAFLDRRRDVFGQPRAEHANAMPLGLRRPFVVGVLPRPLRRDGKNGELRTVVVPRLTLLRVCADEADDSY